MKALIKLEWLKIKGYNVFWWMLGIVALTYPGVNYMFYKVFHFEIKVDNKEDMAFNMLRALLGDPFCFPEAWHSIAYFSSAFVMVPAILVVMLINNEYTYKTHRQNIVDGLMRKEFVWAKLIDVAIISMVITIVYTLTTVVFGLVADVSYANRMYEQLYYIPLFFLQTFAQLSIAFMCGFFIKKSFLAIGVFLMYYVIIENILIALCKYYKLEFYKYFPFEISDRIIPPASFIGKFGENGVEKYQATLNAIPLHVLLTIIFTSGVWFLCFKNYEKRDL